MHHCRLVQRELQGRQSCGKTAPVTPLSLLLWIGPDIHDMSFISSAEVVASLTRVSQTLLLRFPKVPSDGAPVEGSTP